MPGLGTGRRRSRLLDFGGVLLRASDLHVVLGLLEVDARHITRPEELLDPSEVDQRAVKICLGLARCFGCDNCSHAADLFDASVALTHGRICLRDGRVRLGIVKLHEQVAGPDPLPFDDADGHHAP